MQDPIALTEELVSFNTISDRPNAALCQRLIELLKPLGARCTLQRSPHDRDQVNLIARLGPDGRGGLALAGHTDTVPFDEAMRATDVPERVGARLYGRGTCDMKGAIAAMVHASAAVDRDRLRRPLTLAFTFQEEIGCHGAKLLAECMPLGADHAIIGEPTGLRPVTLHKGYVIVQVQLHGAPCHSSDPERGASAVHAAARAIDSLLALGPLWKEREHHPLLDPPYPTLNIGLLRGGTARNVVPAQAEFTVELRPLPGTGGQALLPLLQDRVDAAILPITGTRAELRLIEANDPLHTPSDSEIVRWLVDRTGEGVASVPFYTEAQIFNQMGSTTCVCGPGEIAQAHRVDEWVEIEALGAAEQLYRDAIERFCF